MMLPISAILPLAAVLGAGVLAAQLYRAGATGAELRNQAAAAVALRTARDEQRERADTERTAREAAEAEARRLEHDSRAAAAALIAAQRAAAARADCPERCFVIEWELGE